jgi:hypothetical protein
MSELWNDTNRPGPRALSNTPQGGPGIGSAGSQQEEDTAASEQAQQALFASMLTYSIVADTNGKIGAEEGPKSPFTPAETSSHDAKMDVSVDDDLRILVLFDAAICRVIATCTDCTVKCLAKNRLLNVFDALIGANSSNRTPAQMNRMRLAALVCIGPLMHPRYPNIREALAHFMELAHHLYGLNV